MTSSSTNDYLSNECICSECKLPVNIVEDMSFDPATADDSEDADIRRQSEHPLCEECMNEILEDLKKEIATANSDLSKYTEALFELERDRRAGKFTDDENDAKNALLSHRESELKEEITKLRREEEAVQIEFDRLKKEETHLLEQENSMHDDIISLMRNIIDSEESVESVNRKLQYCQSALKKLKKLNLINEVFYIYHGGASGFGSINGLRLGRPSVPWAEMNAAFGFLCLLLDVLVKKVDINLSQFRLLPRGSSSVLIRKSDKATLELFSDEGSGGIKRFLTGRKFDSAMVGLSQIVAEIFMHLQREDQTLKLPFQIDDQEGKVGGLSVALQFNSDENWSRAMKLLLTNVKWLVAFIEAKD
jgi:beclin 1